MKQFLFPAMPWKSFGTLVLITICGGLIAGGYGVFHDQITYTLSPEYFTKFKFSQFHYADYGLGNRIFAGTIGFLATYWIGLILGWVMGRLTMPTLGDPPDFKLALQSLLIIFAVAVGFGILAYCYATLTLNNERESWPEWQDALKIKDMPAFYRVGTIHNIGYIGGVVGALVGGVWLRMRRGRC